MNNILNTQIKEIITQYPMLCGDRSSCLDLLFCVAGTGYEWKNGVISLPPQEHSLEEILKDEESEVSKALNQRHKIFESISSGKCSQRVKDEEIALIRARVLCSVRRHNMEMIYRQNNAEYLALINNPMQEFYPLSKWSAIANIPNNVNPDYLEGAKEVIFLIFASDSYKTSALYPNNAKQHNIKFADNILQSLAKRFGNADEKITSFAKWKEIEAEINTEALSGIRKDFSS